MKRAFLALMALPLLGATGPEGGYFLPAHRARWLPPTTREDGTALTLAELTEAELAIWVEGTFGEEPARRLGGLDPSSGTGVPIAPLLDGLPDGRYEMAVRVRDRAGNWSGWSNVLAGGVSLVPPAPPTDFSCQ